MLYNAEGFSLALGRTDESIRMSAAASKRWKRERKRRADSSVEAALRKAAQEKI